MMNLDSSIKIKEKMEKYWDLKIDAMVINTLLKIVTRKAAEGLIESTLRL
jgi:hypothetical protein